MLTLEKYRITLSVLPLNNSTQNSTVYVVHPPVHWYDFTSMMQYIVFIICLYLSSVEHILGNLVMQLLLGIPLELVHKGFEVGMVYLAGVLAGEKHSLSLFLLKYRLIKSFQILSLQGFIRGCESCACRHLTFTRLEVGFSSLCKSESWLSEMPLTANLIIPVALSLRLSRQLHLWSSPCLGGGFWGCLCPHWRLFYECSGGKFKFSVIKKNTWPDLMLKCSEFG